MKRTHEKSPQLVTSPKPTTLNLQTRAFAPIQSDSSQVNQQSKNSLEQSHNSSSDSLLEKLISNSSVSSDRPIQRKSLHRFPIQAKLNIGEPNDKYEQEADATASKVVQQINSPTHDKSVQREASMEEEDELQMKPISSIQREAAMEEEDELQMKSLLQRKSSLDGEEASPDLESSIQSAKGSGEPLDPNLQAKMGQAMGADFSDVKVHTDSLSDQLNKSIQAKAFTTGQDLFFRQGEYEPGSRGGQELIAHELTHVVQQNGGSVQRSPKQPEHGKQNLTSVSEDVAIQAKFDAGVGSGWHIHFGDHVKYASNDATRVNFAGRDRRKVGYAWEEVIQANGLAETKNKPDFLACKAWIRTHLPKGEKD